MTSAFSLQLLEQGVNREERQREESKEKKKREIDRRLEERIYFFPEALIRESNFPCAPHASQTVVSTQLNGEDFRFKENKWAISRGRPFSINSKPVLFGLFEYCWCAFPKSASFFFDKKKRLEGFDRVLLIHFSLRLQLF